MTPTAQEAAARALPTWVPHEETGGGMDGQEHQRARNAFESTLQEYAATTGQVMFVGGEFAAYFPGEPRVQPDVFVVPGAEQMPLRHSWVVSKERAAPSFVLELLVLGHRAKDLQDNVVRYAELGIREYFVADFRQRRLRAWRLADSAIRMYTPVVPQLGRIHSEVLGLDLKLEGGFVRLYHGNARLLDPQEITEALRDELNDALMLRQDAVERAADAETRAMSEATARADAEARAALEVTARADAETRAALEATARADAEARTSQEAKARADAEAELAHLRALLESMKGK